MAVHYRTQGFFIKKADQGEANQLFTIYTEDFGRVEVLGRAIRKIKSKLRSGADLFYLSEVEFIQGKAQKTLTDALLIEKFPNIRDNLRKLVVVQKIANVIEELVRGQEKDPAVWELLNETFEKLEEDNSEIVYYYFIWNFLSLSGYLPELSYCVRCREILAPGHFCFSFNEGGVVCNVCSSKKNDLYKINSDLIKVLRLLVQRNWGVLDRMKIDSFTQKLLENVSRTYLSEILGKN